VRVSSPLAQVIAMVSINLLKALTPPTAAVLSGTWLANTGRPMYGGALVLVGMAVHVLRQ